MADEVVGVLDDFIKVSKDDAGLDGGGGVLKADAEDVVEGTHVEDDAGRDGRRAAHDAGAAAVRDDGHAAAVAARRTSDTWAVDFGRTTASGSVCSGISQWRAGMASPA